MKAGTESQTAVIVCMGRALAHGLTAATKFDDPTALLLLPVEAKARVEAMRAGQRPSGIREGFRRAVQQRQSQMMVVRTVAIDDAVRAAGAPQLVILGAGLDGRAFRMTELRDVAVFEVDHPDSQRDKRARAASLVQVARDLRFVPVDFTRDDLDRALQAAGHDPARPTLWLWEGVVMYLAPDDVAATLSIIARRSAPTSRLVILYHCPALMQHLIGFIVRRLGEPLRSIYTAAAMQDLLDRHGFSVVDDQDIATLGATLPAEVARATRIMNHLRIVTAQKR